MRPMKKAKRAMKILALIPAVVFFFSCNPMENDSKSNSYISVENILGTDVNGTSVNFLQSDVIKMDAQTGSMWVFADMAKATLKANLLDPAPLLPASQYNDIMLTRYIVTYSRVDGKNKEGVDVPYSFEGSLSTLLKVGTSSTISFVVVREVAKREPPLISLADGRAEGVMEVIARIQFYGHDMTNKNVKAEGTLTIFFANYGD
jgi:hypothetical protein